MAKVFEVQDGDYIQLPMGTLVFHNNELHAVTEVNDPAGFSCQGAEGCKWSWKDANGLEKVLVEFRQNAKGDGEYYFGAFNKARYDLEVAKNNPKAGDTAMIELATLNPDGFEFRVPVKFSAGVVGLSAGSALTSTDGRYVFQIQTDRNLVGYDMTTNPPEAFWNSGTEI